MVWLLCAVLVGSLLIGCSHEERVVKVQIPVYRQSSPSTCGPSALASICGYYGIQTTEAELARFARTTSKGTTLAGLAEAAQKVGLHATGMQLSLAELQHAPKPLITHVGNNHFVVVVSSRDQHLTLIDPALGARSIPIHDFSQIWKGVVLLLEHLS